MKITTASNHEKRLTSQLISIYHYAKLSRYSHKELMQKCVDRVWNDPSLKKCPGWVRGNLRLRRDNLTNNLFSRYLRWGFKGSDGIIRLSYTELTDEDKEKVNNGEIEGHHYWLQYTSKKITQTGNLLTITEEAEITENYF